MAVFSTQQVRQFYVAKGIEMPANLNAYAAGPNYPSATLAGTMALVKIDDFDHSAAHPSSGGNMAEGYRFMYVNTLGELLGSDLIWRQSIRSIKLTKAADLATKLPEWEITYSAPTGITLAAGDGNVYYLHFRFPGFQNATDEEVMTKTISFVWESTNWADDAAAAINKAFNASHNLHNKLVVATAISATKVSVHALEGKWIRGLHTNKPNQVVISVPEVEVFNDPTLNTIPGDNNYRVKVCGTAEDITAQGNYTVVNSKNIADLEWFCMGERADTFRKAGWPNYVYTEYLVNGNAQYGYDVLDIHFYFQGEGFVDDKSEKQLTIVAEADNSGNVNSILQNFYDAICGNDDTYEGTTTDTPGTDPTTAGGNGSGSGDGGNTGGDGGSTGGDGGNSGGTSGTETPEATAETLSATDVTASGATLNGTATGATTVKFMYGTTSGNLTNDVNNPTAGADNAYSASLTGLDADTTYYYKIVADTVEGSEMSFKTLA